MVQCGVCGLELQARSLYQHLENQHKVYQSRIIDWDLLLDAPDDVEVALLATNGACTASGMECSWACR